LSVIRDEIPRLRERLIQMLEPGIQPISQVVLQPVHGEGKMLRPRLVLMTHWLFAPPSEEALDVAVAVECIHTASLIHDDIIDQSCLRRGQPSTVSLYGPKAAVLIGDHYFATAFRLLSSHGLNAILCDLASVVSDMCCGEINQDLNLFNPYLNEDHYFANIYGKTASLFAGACRAGAMVADASPAEIHTLGQVGLHLGYAYQLTDDVLDLTGQEAMLGKPTGSDLKSGIITLPVIRALAVAAEREWLTHLITSRNITDQDFEQVLTCITRCGAIEYTCAIIAEELSQVNQLLMSFMPSPARERLLTLVSGLTSTVPQSYSVPPQTTEAGR